MAVTDLAAWSRAKLAGKIARLTVFTILLILVVGMFILAAEQLSGGLADVIQSRTSSLRLRDFFRPNRLDEGIPAAFRDDVWNRLTQWITAGELSTPPQVFSVELRIQLSETDVRCLYTISGPSSMMDELRDRIYPVGDFVDQMLGTVTINGRTVRFDNPTTDVLPSGQSMLRMGSDPIRGGNLYEVRIAPPPKTQHLHFGDKRIVASGASPLDVFNAEATGRSDGDLVYKLKVPKAIAELTIQYAGIERQEEPLAKLMERSGLLRLPVLGQLTPGVMVCIPFMLLLVLLRKQLSGEEAKAYCTAVGLVLTLRLGIALLASVPLDPGLAAQNTPSIAALLKRVTGLSFEIYPIYSMPNTLLVTLLAGLLWPILVFRGKRSRWQDSIFSWHRNRIVLAIALVLSLGLVGVWVTLVAYRLIRSPAVGTLSLLGVLLVVLFWLMWELFPAGKALLAAFLGSLTIALVVVSTAMPDYLSSTPGYRALLRSIAIAIIVLFGVPLVEAFLGVTAPLVNAAWLSRFLENRWVVRLCALAICIPSNWLIEGSRIYWGVLWSLTLSLSDLFLFALLVVLLRILKNACPADSSSGFSALVIDTGIVLALTFFYSSTSIWFYFPIPLVLGWVLLRWFLLVSPVDPHLAARVQKKWKELAHSELKVRQLERTSSAVRKGLEDKLAKGKILWSEYQEKLAPVNAAVEAEKENVKIENKPVGALLFSSGASVSAWDGGCTAAVYSILFAMPWIFLSLRDVLNSYASETYVLLSFLSSALLIIARWTLYGFFFGYFYAHIRGKNGFQKALCFWFALVLPSLVAALLSFALTKASLSSLLFWTAQVFIHCILLGLFAGELQSLWKAEMSWRQLLDFHNLTALSAWGSSLLLALGAAITTALSTGLGQIIAMGLKYAGVLPPGTTPAK